MESREVYGMKLPSGFQLIGQVVRLNSEPLQ